MTRDGIKKVFGQLREDAEKKFHSFLQAKVYGELKFVPDETFATNFLRKAVKENVLFQLGKMNIDTFTKKNYRMTYSELSMIRQNSEQMMKTRYHNGIDNKEIPADFPGTLALAVEKDQDGEIGDGPYLHPKYRKYGNNNNDEFEYFMRRLMEWINPSQNKFNARYDTELIREI